MCHHSVRIGIIAMALLSGITTAQAGNESWVSGTGTDAGTCPRTAPCRTFQFAHDQTSNNGAINVLTAGNFGPVTITKPISIVADGVEAVINSAANGAAININAGGGAVISLRGLTIDMRGTGNYGILFNGGGALHVHNTSLRRSSDGIRFTNSSGNSELYVSDTVLSDSTQSANLMILPTGSGSVKAVLDRVRAENASQNGISILGGFTTGSVIATVRDSVSAGNTFNGLLAAEEADGGSTIVMIDRSAFVNNNTGVVTTGAGPSTIRIGDSAVMGNFTGLSPGGSGTIVSYGTNKVDGNTVNGDPSSTIAMK